MAVYLWSLPLSSSGSLVLPVHPVLYPDYLISSRLRLILPDTSND